MKAFALIFNDGRDVDQNFLDELEVTTFIQNWLYINPIIYLVSNESVHYLAKAISGYDPSRWFFITEIVIGSNNGMQPAPVWNFLNSPQPKYTASSNLLSELLGSSPSKSSGPLPPPRASAPPLPGKPPTLPSPGILKALSDLAKDKK